MADESEVVVRNLGTATVFKVEEAGLVFVKTGASIQDLETWVNDQSEGGAPEGVYEIGRMFRKLRKRTETTTRIIVEVVE
jgi:hypothetical protein